MSPLLWFSILAGTAPLLASTIPFYIFKNGINPRSFQILLGLSAGLLFSIATLELIPESFQMAQLQPKIETSLVSPKETRSILSYSYSYSLAKNSYSTHKLMQTDGGLGDGDVDTELKQGYVEEDHDHDHDNEDGGARIGMLGLGCGFLFLILLEQVMSGGGHSHSHSHSFGKGHEEEEEENKLPGLSTSLSTVAFVGLAFHSLVDGMIIAGAFTASPETGSRVAIAILLHKFPDGFVMSSIVASQHAKNPSMHRFAYIAAIALMTPLGAFIGNVLLGGIPPIAVAFVLGFGAGTFLYITATGIVPELTQAKGPDKVLSIAAIIAGYLGFLIIDTSLHAH